VCGIKHTGEDKQELMLTATDIHWMQNLKQCN